MKLTYDRQSIGVRFPSGAELAIPLSEIVSIDLQTAATMTVDVDIVCLNYENGEFFEISDEAEGFSAVCDHVSSELGILPAIRARFPVAEGRSIRIYERNEN